MRTLFATAAEMQARLGGIPLERIRMNPAPGTATVEDVLRIREVEGRLCELVDGVLVEKPMGYYESRVAVALIHFIELFLDRQDLGIVLGEAGFLRVLPQQVRAPDVSFIGWEHFPGKELPAEEVPFLAPDLAVEVLSPGNTEEEIARKIAEYFEGGSRRVWVIDPRAKTARSYSSELDSAFVGKRGSLRAEDVLPGFSLSLEKLFRKAGKRRGR